MFSIKEQLEIQIQHIQEIEESPDLVTSIEIIIEELSHHFYDNDELDDSTLNAVFEYLQLLPKTYSGFFWLKLLEIEDFKKYLIEPGKSVKDHIRSIYSVSEKEHE